MVLRERTAASLFFFFNDTATTEIYTLSLHDALPIYSRARGDQPRAVHGAGLGPRRPLRGARDQPQRAARGPCQPPPSVRPRRSDPDPLRAVVHLDAEGRLGLLVREPHQRGHPDPAAAAHHPLGTRAGPVPGSPGGPAGRDLRRDAPVLALRPDRDDLRLRRLLAAHLLHRHPVHPVLQHLPRLAPLHLPRRHQRDRLALVLGERPPGAHAGGGARPGPGRLDHPLRPLPHPRRAPPRLHHPPPTPTPPP